MQERETDWPALIGALLEGSERDRDVAAWRTCAEVVKALDRFKPAVFAQDANWTLDDQEHIAKLARFPGSLEDLREAAAVRAATFGRYRAAVTEHEALEARKLQTLVWCLQTLYRLRDKSTDTGAVDRLATRIGDLLTLDWRCKTVPLEGDYRAWASSVTRRMDLLPRHWRLA